MKIKKSFMKNNDSQLIVLMGIILAISVFTVSYLASDIANLDVVISSERSESLLKEFSSIKESFVYSLNYNLVYNIKFDIDGLKFYGDIHDLSEAFEKTKEEYYDIELMHDIIFDAKLNEYTALLPGGTDGIYQVEVTLMLKSKDTTYTEDVSYIIICIANPDVPGPG